MKWKAFMLTIWCLNSAHAEPRVIVMASVANSEKSPTAHFCELVYKEAFHRLGYEFTLTPLPALRASSEANSGTKDGEPSRRFEHNQDFPNLIRVDEPIYMLNISAFSANPLIHLHGWESLRGTKYKIDYMRGVLIVPQNLAFLPASQLMVLNERTQALKRLASGRSDLYIDGEADIIAMLKESGNRQIYRAGVMTRLLAYPFLHKKHADLIVPLATVMRKMKQEGLFSKYKAQLNVKEF